jgi:transposase InsO family protein
VTGEASSVTQKVISMQTKLAAVLAREAAGEVVSVTQVCANLAISRDTYYRYRRRFAVQGLDGLVPRSRRPHHSPRRLLGEVEDTIVTARKVLAEEGWDNGAISIRARLLRDGVDPVPCVRTIHRLLVRLGLVTPTPGKRPRSSYRRFEFPASDDCWQIDALDYTLAGGAGVVVFELLDDHSRYQLANLAWPSENGTGAWTCVATAISRYGPPRMLLSDNGLAFSGARRHRQVAFEHNLRALGIHPITSRPYHPQTCGKNERGHQTLRRWLAAHPPAATLPELQTHLDTYRAAYNQRPHQGISGQTPARRHTTGARPHPPNPATAADPARTHTSTATVNGRGQMKAAGTHIGVGSQWANTTLTVFNTDGHILLFHRDTLVRELTLDPTRTFQPTGKPRGGTRMPRISDTVQ